MLLLVGQIQELTARFPKWGRCPSDPNCGSWQEGCEEGFFLYHDSETCAEGGLATPCCVDIEPEYKEIANDICHDYCQTVWEPVCDQEQVSLVFVEGEYRKITKEICRELSRQTCGIKCESSVSYELVRRTATAGARFLKPRRRYTGRK